MGISYHPSVFGGCPNRRHFNRSCPFRNSGVNKRCLIDVIVSPKSSHENFASPSVISCERRTRFSWLNTLPSNYFCASEGVVYKKNPAPDGHRCGVCPTYFQKICAFDFGSNATFIFDNHCVMDLYNCIHGTEFINQNYENCLYFGNFGYVHGYKYEDYDYGEDHIVIMNSQKNPDFVK